MVYENYLVSFLCLLYYSVISLFCLSVLQLILILDLICNQNYLFEQFGHL